MAFLLLALVFVANIKKEYAINNLSAEDGSKGEIIIDVPILDLLLLICLCCSGDMSLLVCH
jgi:hypothetical protein